MKRKHEQSIVDGAFNIFNKIAKNKHRRLIRCSMDGQDSIYGADYFFTNNSKFILTEFKYEESDLISENNKPRRKKLCENLDKERLYRTISEKCHYIAWSEKKHTRKVLLNQYYQEICNQSVFIDSPLIKKIPNKEKRLLAEIMFDDFLNDKIGADYFSFKKYTTWLYFLDKGERKDRMELIVDNPDKDQLELIDFKSISSFKQWMDQTTYRSN